MVDNLLLIHLLRCINDVYLGYLSLIYPNTTPLTTSCQLVYNLLLIICV